MADASTINRLMAVSALVEPGARMYVTATVWAALALEIGDARGEHPKPTPDNFEAIRFGNLLVVNSGSENEEACHRLNRGDAERSGFQWKREHWRVG